MVDPRRGPVLVFGGGGYLGRALVAHLDARFDIEAPSHGDVDVVAADDVSRCVARRMPRAIVNLAAARPGSPFQTTNDEGAGNVARAAAAHGARLVHVSTDMVLDGRTPPYADDAPARPLNSYGRSKAAGESAVRASGADAVVIRTSLIWDPHEMGRGVNQFAERLARGEPARLFTDEVRCPVTRGALAAAIEVLLDVPITGTLNVAGKEALTRYDFLTLLLEYFDVRGRERVERARAADLELPPDEQRPRDLTLDVSRAERLLRVEMVGAREVLRS